MKYSEYPEIKDVQCSENYIITATFSDGSVKKFDMSSMIDEKKCYSALKNRELFVRGKTLGKWAISWNDDVDIAAEYIFDNGV